MFPHKDNLESKIRNNYKGERKFLQRFYDRFYMPWHRRNIGIKHTTPSYIKRKVALLNDYYLQIDRILEHGPSGKTYGWITSQSKLRPTVLEEFCFYLLKDLHEIKKLKLDFVKKGIHAGFRLDSKGIIATIKKDVDCCITKKEDGLIGGRKIQFIIPVISIECKTYLDGTMWNESQYTALLLKRSNPSSKVYALTETNQVDLDKITKESPVNEIFVLRESNKDKIDFRIVLDFFNQIATDLLEISAHDKKFIKGRLINR